MIRALRTWIWAVRRVGQLEALRPQLAQAQQERLAALRQVAVVKEQCRQWQVVDEEHRAEIQRLIREVGSLERQMNGVSGPTPVTVIADGPAYAPQEERLPAADPIPPPKYSGFREAAADLVNQPEKVRAVLDEWWERHPRPKPSATP